MRDANDDEENDVGVEDDVDDISCRRVEGCDDESDNGDVRCWLRPGFACSDANDDEECDVGDGDDDIALRHVEVCDDEDDDGDVHCRLKGPVLCAATKPPYGLWNLPPARS